MLVVIIVVVIVVVVVIIVVAEREALYFHCFTHIFVSMKLLGH